MGSRTNSLRSFLIGRRRWIQGFIGIGLYAAMSLLGLSFWWILGIGVLSGFIFGKVFCRWACPIGFLMESLTKLGGEDGKFQRMYQYHKLGCPIAWASGILNKYSIFKIKLDKTSCSKCGRCDKACYISTLDPTQFSVFKNDRERPATAYACSKCLACVETCPTGSLSYTAGSDTPSRRAPK